MKKTSILIIVASLLAAVTSVKADPYRRPVVRPVQCCDAHYRGHWAASLWIWDAPLAPVVTVAPPVCASPAAVVALPASQLVCRVQVCRAPIQLAALVPGYAYVDMYGNWRP
jgi:hypothetical protein